MTSEKSMTIGRDYVTAKPENLGSRFLDEDTIRVP